VLMSDHGSTAIDTVFHLNTWLAEEGYLVLNKGSSDVAFKLGITKERLIRLTTALGLKNFARRIVPRSIRHQIPHQEGGVRFEGKAKAIDWKRTTAVASGQGVLYLNCESPEEKERLQDEIIEKLQSLRAPDGRPIAEDIYCKEDIYEGKYLDEAPDILLDQTEGIHIPGSMRREEIFTSAQTEGWKAENKRNGLFVANGPAFGESEVDPLSILDLAPLFLHLHDYGIPEQMDGKVPYEVFSAGSDPAVRVPTYITRGPSSDYCSSPSDDLQERLTDLGYLD